MTPQDKQLKLQLVVDEASFSKARNAIREITADVSKLVAELNRAGSGFMGGRGGGGFFGGASGNAGGVNASHQTTTSQSKQGGFGAQLTQGLVAQRDLFKNLSTGSKDTMKAMADAVRDSVSSQSREIERLTQILNKASAAYQQLKATGAGVPGAQNVQSAQLNTVMGAATNVAAAQQQLNQMKSAGGNMGFYARQAAGDTEGYYDSYEVGGGGGGRRGIRSRLAAFAGGEGSFLNKEATGGNIMGALMGRLGGLGVAAGVGIHEYNRWAQLGESNEQANARHYLYSAMQPYEMKGTQGAAYQMAEAIRSGDVGRGTAARKVLQSEEFRKYISGNAARARVDAASLQAGFSMTTGGIKNTALQRYTNWRMSGDSISGTTAGGMDFGRAGMTPQDINIQESLQSMPADVMAKFSSATDAEMSQDPLLQKVIASRYGGALSNFAFQRSIGAQGKAKWNQAGNQLLALPYWQQYQVNALRRGYSGSEMAGLGQQFMGQARSYKGLENRYIGLQSGGLSNVAELYGAGNQFGSGAGFINAVQSNIGAGGLDITVGSRLAGASAQMMTGSADFGGASGTDFMRGMAASSFTGIGAGADSRMAQLMPQGMQEMNRPHSGLDAGISHLVSMRAANGNYYAASALEMLSPEMKMEILRSKGKKLPSWLADAGVTYDMVRQFEAGRTSFMFSDMATGVAGNTKMSKLISEYQQSGMGLTDFATKKLGQKGGRAQLNQLADQLGTAYYLKNQGKVSRNLAVAGFRGVMGMSSDLVPNLKGHGAYMGIQKGSLEESAAAEQAKTLKTEFEKAENEGPQIADSFRNREANSAAVKQFGGSGLPGVISDVADALEEAAGKIRSVLQGAHSTAVNNLRESAAKSHTKPH